MLQPTPKNMFAALSEKFTGIRWPTISAVDEGNHFIVTATEPHVVTTVDLEVTSDGKIILRHNINGTPISIREFAYWDQRWIKYSLYGAVFERIVNELHEFYRNRWLNTMTEFDDPEILDQYTRKWGDAYDENLWIAVAAFRGGLVGRPFHAWYRKATNPPSEQEIQARYWGLFGTVMETRGLVNYRQAEYKSDFHHTWKLYWLSESPYGRECIERAMQSSPWFRKSVMRMPKGRLPKAFSLGSIADLVLHGYQLGDVLTNDRYTWMALSALSRDGRRVGTNSRQQLIYAARRATPETWRRFAQMHGYKLVKTAHIMSSLENMLDAEYQFADGMSICTLAQQSLDWHQAQYSGTNNAYEPETPCAVPPIPLPDGVEFIATAGRMATESKIMHHCVSSYTRNAVNGTDYFFHYQNANGDMATAQVDQNGNLVQCYGVCNETNQASGELRQIALEWGSQLQTYVLATEFPGEPRKVHVAHWGEFDQGLIADPVPEFFML